MIDCNRTRQAIYLAPSSISSGALAMTTACSTDRSRGWFMRRPTKWQSDDEQRRRPTQTADNRTEIGDLQTGRISLVTTQSLDWRGTLIPSAPSDLLR